jgi:hypothetical protein
MEREPSWLCISDQVIDGVNPKWGVIMVYVEILFINLLFMPPPPASRAPPSAVKPEVELVRAWLAQCHRQSRCCTPW